MTTIRFEGRMSDQDALMWAIEKDPLLRSTITSITLFDAELDGERLLAQLDRATRMIPRLRQKVVSPPLRRRAALAGSSIPTSTSSSTSASSGRPARARSATCSTTPQPFAMSGFDRARPLWEFVVFDGLEGSRSALVQKMHHSLIDGVGAMKITMAFLDTTREGKDRGPLPEVPPSEHPDFVSLLRDGLGHDVRRVGGAVGRLPREVLSTALDPVGATRRSARMAGSARPDAAAGVGAAEPDHGRPVAQRALRHADRLAPRPQGGGQGGGRDAQRRVRGRGGRRAEALPRQARRRGRAAAHDHADQHAAECRRGRRRQPVRAGPVRVPAVDRRSCRTGAGHARPAQGQRDEPALGALGPVSTILNQLPLGLSTAALGAMLKGIDVVTSNVPGAPIPIYAVGARMEANFGFGPLTGAGCNITLLSYLDEVHLGISTDPAAVPDPEVFVDCLQDGFDEVLALAR